MFETNHVCTKRQTARAREREREREFQSDSEMLLYCIIPSEDEAGVYAFECTHSRTHVIEMHTYTHIPGTPSSFFPLSTPLLPLPFARCCVHVPSPFLPHSSCQQSQHESFLHSPFCFHCLRSARHQPFSSQLLLLPLLFPRPLPSLLCSTLTHTHAL